MEYTIVEETVKSINAFVKKQLWMDFEFASYNWYDLIIGGTIDTSESDYLIEIRFTDVYYVSLNNGWQSDTSKDVLKILTDSEVNILRSSAAINPDCFVFQFISDDLITPLVIAAKEIFFEEKK